MYGEIETGEISATCCYMERPTGVLRREPRTSTWKSVESV